MKLCASYQVQCWQTVFVSRLQKEEEKLHLEIIHLKKNFNLKIGGNFFF
jgi:hypothetical protein